MAKRKSTGKAKPAKNIDDSNGSVDNEEYEVEKVIHHRKFSSGGVEYLIRWKGYGPDDDTWEKESNLTSSAVLIAEYKELNKVSSDEEMEDDKEEDDEKTNGKDNKGSDAEEDEGDEKDDAHDDDFDATPAKKKKSTPAKKASKGKTAKASKSKGRGRPKGSTKEEVKKKSAGKKSKKEESDDDGEETTEEYEVEKIIEVHNGKNGKEYLVRWKGFSSKDDTWEPEEHLTCPDLIKQFNDKLGKIKSVTPKSLRAAPAKTNRLSVQNSTSSGRHSKRFVGKRKSYAEDE